MTVVKPEAGSADFAFRSMMDGWRMRPTLPAQAVPGRNVYAPHGDRCQGHARSAGRRGAVKERMPIRVALPIGLDGRPRCRCVGVGLEPELAVLVLGLIVGENDRADPVRAEALVAHSRAKWSDMAYAPIEAGVTPDSPCMAVPSMYRLANVGAKARSRRARVMSSPPRPAVAGSSRTRTAYVRNGCRRETAMIHEPGTARDYYRVGRQPPWRSQMLSWSRGDVLAVERVGLRADAGEIYALPGLNGSLTHPSSRCKVKT
jgi:hypothetical protein